MLLWVNAVFREHGKCGPWKSVNLMFTSGQEPSS